MTNLSKQTIPINNCLVFGNHDSILICALFTLNPNTTLFKKLDLSNKSSITTPTLKKILNNKEFFTDLYDALNNKAIRQLDKIALPSTNKELNTKAIKALFLILGI